MGLLIGSGILSVCVFVAWMVLRRPLRQIVEDVHVDHARACFTSNENGWKPGSSRPSAKFDPAEGQRWEAAQWHDEVLWARDRQTRCLLALVCVHFEPGPFDEFPGTKARHGALRVSQGPMVRRGQEPGRDAARRGGRPRSSVRRSRRHAAPSAPGRLNRRARSTPKAGRRPRSWLHRRVIRGSYRASRP